jgi:hypothetical protein
MESLVLYPNILPRPFVASRCLALAHRGEQDPWHHQCPGTCGRDENTNGLLRRYLLKGTDLSGTIQRELKTIAHGLNNRLRKCLNRAMPLEVLA